MKAFQKACDAAGQKVNIRHQVEYFAHFSLILLIFRWDFSFFHMLSFCYGSKVNSVSCRNFTKNPSFLSGLFHTFFCEVLRVLVALCAVLCHLCLSFSINKFMQYYVSFMHAYVLCVFAYVMWCARAFICVSLCECMLL